MRHISNVVKEAGNMKTLRSQDKRHGDESGQTLLMFVLFLVVLVLFVGLGIDLGFAYVTRANLSKAVDAACLMGIRNISQENAEDIALSTFFANYGRPGRDAGDPNVQVKFDKDGHDNIILNVDAAATVNTFFIRLLPQWSTLPVQAHATATRNKLVISLVLDRSGSMNDNGGAAALPGAVSNFIDFFDDKNDQAATVSFAPAASTDVTMRHPFKTKIKDAANAMTFGGWTCSERGLTNGLAQNYTVNVRPGENVIKVIVFFTDGMANTWYYNFDCGPRNISPDRLLWDPDTGASATAGCTVPGTLPSINGSSVVTTQCAQMNLEAQARAERIASLARDAGNIVYAIGMGDPNAPGECGGTFRALNPDFLKNIANTPDAPKHVDGQTVGAYVIAANSGALEDAFRQIADKILLRITR
jgi:Flp pilus assembly protein TadG